MKIQKFLKLPAKFSSRAKSPDESVAKPVEQVSEKVVTSESDISELEVEEQPRA